MTVLEISQINNTKYHPISHNIILHMTQYHKKIKDLIYVHNIFIDFIKLKNNKNIQIPLR